MSKIIKLPHGVSIQLSPGTCIEERDSVLIHFGENSWIKIDVPLGHCFEDLNLDWTDGDGYKGLNFDAPND